MVIDGSYGDGTLSMSESDCQPPFDFTPESHIYPHMTQPACFLPISPISTSSFTPISTPGSSIAGPLLMTVDPKLIHLNPFNAHQSTFGYRCEPLNHMDITQSSTDTSRVYHGAEARSIQSPATISQTHLSSSTCFSSSLAAISSFEEEDISRLEPNFSTSHVTGRAVIEVGGGRFKCGFTGCNKIHDRKSRARDCEYRHYGVKPFQCSGACGNPNR
jgi:hypothetical protein